MVGDWRTSRFLVKELPSKGMNLMGLCKDQALGGKMHHGGQWQEQTPGKDQVLDHIILDLTGGSRPLEHTDDASVQRQFQRKKRLLRKSNTVLVSRLAIMALVAIMLVVTTLLTWYYTSTYSARSVKSLASVLRQQLLRNSLQAMVTVLGELYNATVVLSSLHQGVYFASTNHTWESVEPELRMVNDGVFRAQGQYSSVAFVGVDGRVTDYSRNSKNAQYLLFVNATRDQPQVWYIQNVTGLVNETNAAQPIVRKPPYPLSAENLLNVSPTQMYWSIAPNSFGNPVVSPAIPVKDLQTNTLLGLSTITTTFANLNSYLSTIDLLGGYLYFEWHNGTNSSAVVAVSYNATHDLLQSPEDSNNAVVKAAATFLAANYGYNQTGNNRTHSSDVKLMGQKYYIDTMPLILPPFGPLNLTAVVIVPRKSIMGKIDQRNRTVIGVSVGTAIGVLLLGCCFICFVTGRMSTEMHLRQELIRQLVGKHRAEQSSNYKSQFLANMSHEMRTPMAGIIGLLDLLSCDSLTPEQEYSVAQIRRCATGLLALVNNVLDISKAEAGKLELDISRFSVADELESLVDMFAAQSVKSSIDVALDLSDNIPAVVRGDANRIRQIFSNLLSNSVKFTAHGHVLVRGWVDQSLLEPERKSTDYTLAAVARREKGSGSIPVESENKLALIFEVDDSGCGIPVDLREAVFDSFVQGDDSMTRIHGGSGLGLYIVRSLVELMGGQVAVLPKQGSGTLVRFHVIVEKASHPDLKKAPDELQPIDLPSSDGLNSLLGSPATLPVTEQMPSPEVLARTQVVVAMEEGVSREIAAQWLERNGLTVTCVDVWEDIVPILEDMCKNTITDSHSDKELVIDDTVKGSHSSPAHFQSLDSKSQASESNRFPSVLALVDISMHPSSKLSFERQVLEPSFLEARENSLTRSDPEKLPGHVQNILDSMTRIHSEHSLAVGWIVAPDCGPKWKHSLQADNSFLVMNKPLLGTRMRRLLCLLSRTGKLEQHQWEAHSHQSSPSTAGLHIMHSEGESVISRPVVIPLPDESFINCPTDFRDPSVQSTWISADTSTHSARTSTDEAPKYDKSESGEANHIEIAPEVLAIAQQQPIRISLSRESSLVSLNCNSEPMSQVKDAPESLDRQVLTETEDKSRKLGAESSESLQETPSIISGSIPEMLSSSLSVPPITPEESTSGSGNPEGANSHLHGGSDLQRNAVEIKEVGDEWSLVNLSLSDNQSQRRRSLSEWPAARNESGNARNSRRKSLSGWPADTKDGVVSSAESTPEMPISTAPARASNAASASVFATKALASIHILLVEDTPVLQRLACIMLKKLGAIVTVVGDGLQAVTAVSEALEAPQTTSATVELSNIRHFDLILMDCAMPVMDGYSATLAIRAAEEKTSRHIPIVALTAHALASDEERCLSVGMDAYLTKPINCKLLVTTIQELVVKDRA